MVSRVKFRTFVPSVQWVREGREGPHLKNSQSYKLDYLLFVHHLQEILILQNQAFLAASSKPAPLTWPAPFRDGTNKLFFESLIHKYSSFNPLDCKQFKTLALDPTIRDNLTRVRVIIGYFRPVIVAIVPVLADAPLRGAEGYYAGGFELDFISHDQPL